MNYWGDFNTGATVPLFFTTHAQTGAAVAPSSAFEVADIILYKNGSATQRTSQSGWTITSPFDSITGLHCLTIDLSDNTDSGFYAAGNTYTAVLSPDETVDSLAVVKVLGQFGIERCAKVDVAKLLGTAWLTPAVAGTPDVNAKQIGGYVPSQIKGLGKTIYVATTGNDSNAGTAASPKLTINGAIAAMNDGDTCRIGAGTFAKALCALNHCTFEGANRGVTIVSTSTGSAFEITGDYNTLVDMTCTSTDTATGTGQNGVRCYNTTGTKLIALTITGIYDGLYAAGAIDCLVANCDVTGAYDGANFTEASGFVRQSNFYTNGLWQAVSSETADGFRGVVIESLGRLKFDQCKFVAVQSLQTSKPTAAVVVGGDDQGVNNHESATFNDCKFYATASHASNTGKVYCIGHLAPLPLAYFATINGGFMTYSNSGSGENRHIYAPTSGSKIVANQVMTHLALNVDTPSHVITSLRPTTAGTTLDVSSTGEAGIDLANVGSPTTTLNLSGTTIKTATDIATAIDDVPTVAEFQARTLATASYATAAVLGTPAGASIAADIAAKATQASVDTINTKIGTPADTLAEDIAGIEAGGGTPAQVHNEKPVPAFTAKLGTRADGVVRAFPRITVTPTDEGHVWIDCTKLLSDNVENVTDAESSDEDVAEISSVGPYEKFVSIKFDSSGAEVGDTATFTCTVPKIGPVAVDIIVKAP